MKILNCIRVVIALFILMIDSIESGLGQFSENILLQVDRDLYIAGEDVLINAYIYSTNDNVLSSKVLYVELYDSDNHVIVKKKLEINKDVATGKITIPKSISTQTYLIRAYTNTYKNFRPEIYSTKVLSIVNPNIPFNSENEEPPDSDESKLIPLKNTIAVLQNEEYYTFKASKTNEVHEIYFVIYSNTFQPVYKSLLTSSLNIKIPENKIPLGLNYVAIQNIREDIISVRPFYNWQEKDVLDFKLDKTEYKPREKVTFSIENRDLFRYFSVSVIKSGTVDYETIPANVLNNLPLLNFFLMENHSLVNHLKDTVDFYLQKAGEHLLAQDNFAINQKEFEKNNKNFTKEFIGPSLKGKVLTDKGLPKENLRLYLSVFSGEQQLHSTTSDSTGKFTFLLYPRTYGINRLIIRDEPIDSLPVKILLDYDFSNKFAETPVKMIVDSSYRDLLEQLYFNFQVEEQVGSDKHTTNNNEIFYFYGKPDYSVNLEDYINLPNLEEVFNEIIPYVSVKRKNKSAYLSVYNDNREVFYNSPLVMLDFIPIFNIDELLKISPESIYKIDVVNKTYRLGEFTYHGIVNIVTVKNNFSEYTFPNDVVFLDFEGVSYPYNFENERYFDNTAKQSRIPDFRTVLYWNPNIISDTVSFYTSDHCSDYKIIITGVDETGNIIKSLQSFSVKQ